MSGRHGTTYRSEDQERLDEIERQIESRIGAIKTVLDRTKDTVRRRASLDRKCRFLETLDRELDRVQIWSEDLHLEIARESSSFGQNTAWM